MFKAVQIATLARSGEQGWAMWCLHCSLNWVKSRKTSIAGHVHRLAVISVIRGHGISSFIPRGFGGLGFWGFGGLGFRVLGV